MTVNKVRLSCNNTKQEVISEIERIEKLLDSISQLSEVSFKLNMKLFKIELRLMSMRTDIKYLKD